MREGARRYSRTLWDVMVLTGYREVGRHQTYGPYRPLKYTEVNQWTHWDGTGLSHAKNKVGHVNTNEWSRKHSDSKAFSSGTQG